MNQKTTPMHNPHRVVIIDGRGTAGVWAEMGCTSVVTRLHGLGRRLAALAGLGVAIRAW